MIEKNKGYRYAAEVLEGKIPAPMYVKKQLKEFVEIAEGKNDKYIISEKKYTLISKILKLIVMPKGAQKGKTAYGEIKSGRIGGKSHPEQGR